MSKELLEAAARAAGYRLADHQDPEAQALWVFDGDRLLNFAPMVDDGDALRLVVKLNLWVNVYSPSQSTPQFTNVIYHDPFTDINEEHGSDALAATRLAIVRAAAAIGNKLEKPE